MTSYNFVSIAIFLNDKGTYAHTQKHKHTASVYFAI